jgi:hypothetical protein
MKEDFTEGKRPGIEGKRPCKAFEILGLSAITENLSNITSKFEDIGYPYPLVQAKLL